MRIGIIGAMNEEVILLINHMKKKNVTEIAGRSYYEGELYDQEVIVVFSRWGKVAATITTTTLINYFHVNMLLFTGVAGGVSEKLNIGDVVVASKLLHHDLDARPIYKLFEVPLLNQSYFEIDSKLIDCCIDAVQKFILTNRTNNLLVEFGIKTPKVYSGIVASGDQFIAGGERLSEILLEIPDLLCVEMEGAAFAQVCYEHNIPFIVIRTISDNALTGAHLDFQNFVKNIAAYYSQSIVKNIFTNKDFLFEK